MKWRVMVEVTGEDGAVKQNVISEAGCCMEVMRAPSTWHRTGCRSGRRRGMERHDDAFRSPLCRLPLSR